MFHFCCPKSAAKATLNIPACGRSRERAASPDSFMCCERRALMSGDGGNEVTHTHTHTGHLHRWAKACVSHIQKNPKKPFLRGCLLKMWHIQGALLRWIKKKRARNSFVYIVTFLLTSVFCTRRDSTSTGICFTLPPISPESGLSLYYSRQFPLLFLFPYTGVATLLFVNGSSS